jgi:hypothetical protein
MCLHRARFGLLGLSLFACALGAFSAKAEGYTHLYYLNRVASTFTYESSTYVADFQYGGTDVANGPDVTITGQITSYFGGNSEFGLDLDSLFYSVDGGDAHAFSGTAGGTLSRSTSR